MGQGSIRYTSLPHTHTLRTQNTRNTTGTFHNILTIHYNNMFTHHCRDIMIAIKSRIEHLVWLWAGTQRHIPSCDKYDLLRSCMLSPCPITLTRHLHNATLTKIWSEFHYRSIIDNIIGISSSTSSLRPQHQREIPTLLPLTIWWRHQNFNCSEKRN